MKEENQSSSDAPLSELLRESRLSPVLPPRFQQNVWRRIEDAEAPGKPASWLDALANLILRPQFALVAVAIVLLVGVLAGAMEGRTVAQHDAQMNYLASVVPHGVR